MARRTRAEEPDPAVANREAGFAAVRASPLFGPLLRRASPHEIGTWGVRASALRRGGLLAVDAHGGLIYNSRARAGVETWTWSLSHALSHLGFGHADPDHRDGRGSFSPEWRAACCLAVDRFLGVLEIPGTPAVPHGFDGDEAELADRFAEQGIPASLATGPGGGGPDLWEDLFEGRRSRTAPASSVWGRTFALGLAAIDGPALAAGPTRTSDWLGAVEWFTTSCPMLGELAEGLKIVEEARVCRAPGIAVAAVCPASGEMYLNPDVALTAEERRFVIAHQLLHAGLRHDARSGGRPTRLYQVAADHVVNGWLIEMGLGTMPRGCLHDPQLAGLGVDQAYDGLARNMRRFSRLASSAATCVGDVLDHPVPRPGGGPGVVDLDGFYRRSLLRGLDLHRTAGRGAVPAGLEQDIRAQAQPA